MIPVVFLLHGVRGGCLKVKDKNSHRDNNVAMILFTSMKVNIYTTR